MWLLLLFGFLIWLAIGGKGRDGGWGVLRNNNGEWGSGGGSCRCCDDGWACDNAAPGWDVSNDGDRDGKVDCDDEYDDGDNDWDDDKDECNDDDIDDDEEEEVERNGVDNEDDEPRIVDNDEEKEEDDEEGDALDKDTPIHNNNGINWK